VRPDEIADRSLQIAGGSLLQTAICDLRSDLFDRLVRFDRRTRFTRWTVGGLSLLAFRGLDLLTLALGLFPLAFDD
jgi:hypothetical protein